MTLGGRELIRVLIVDDDSRVRSAIRTLLVAHAGFEVVGEAGSTDLAVRLANAMKPCVALVDVLMPTEQDGLSLLRTFAQQHHIPVVAMSLDNAFGRSALAAGARTFLTKDGRPEVLIHALREAHQEA